MRYEWEAKKKIPGEVLEARIQAALSEDPHFDATKFRKHLDLRCRKTFESIPIISCKVMPAY